MSLRNDTMLKKTDFINICCAQSRSLFQVHGCMRESLQKPDSPGHKTRGRMHCTNAEIPMAPQNLMRARRQHQMQAHRHTPSDGHWLAAGLWYGASREHRRAMHCEKGWGTTWNTSTVTQKSILLMYAEKQAAHKSSKHVRNHVLPCMENQPLYMASLVLPTFVAYIFGKPEM